MIICSQQVFDKFYLDADSEFLEYISSTAERELVNKVVDTFKDHKLYIVKLHEPEVIEDFPGDWHFQLQSAYRQKLEYEEVIQCKDCRMVYPWCQKFRDEFGGNGFCPYGKEFKDESFE